MLENIGFSCCLGVVLFLCSTSVLSAQQVCERYAQSTACMLEDEGITEASGLAASHQHNGAFWVHNDSGDAPRLFAFDIQTGATLAILDITGIDAVDWEDMAIAPCSQDRQTECIYIADIGNNAENRQNLVIHQVREPEMLGDGITPLILSATPVSSFPVTYPFTDAATEAPLIPDAEAFAVDRSTLKLFLWTKEERRSRLLVKEAWNEQNPTPFTYLTEFPFGFATAADISPSGDRFAVRVYGSFYEFATNLVEVEDGASIVTEPTVKKVVAGEFQGEAIAYSVDGLRLYTVSEGFTQPVSEFVCSPKTPENPDMTPTSPPDMGTPLDMDAGFGQDMHMPTSDMMAMDMGSPEEMAPMPDSGCQVASLKSGQVFGFKFLILFGFVLCGVRVVRRRTSQNRHHQS